MNHRNLKPIYFGTNFTNHILTGLLFGLIVPAITFFIIYKVRYVGGAKNILFMFPNLYVPMIQLSLVPNLGLFFLFNWKDKIFSTRGVVLATILIGIGLIVLNFSTLE